MKPGRRALGVAESYRTDTSTLGGAVVRADRVVDGLAFDTCTVGGTDATATILDIFDRLDREDIAYLIIAGIAPAWFNVVDLPRLHDVTGLPSLAVSFEESGGLGPAIRDAFEGDEADERLARYRAQPARHAVDGVYVRGVGCDEAEMDRVVRAFTPDGASRPEPLRVARLAARAADEFRR